MSEAKGSPGAVQRGARPRGGFGIGLAHGARTDWGTAVLHALLLGAFCVLLATGLRLAGGDGEAIWLFLLDPVLPMEHLWYRHLLAGVVLAAVMAGYAVYMARARLAARVRFDRTRLLALWRGGEPRFAALHVAVVW